MKAQHTFKVNLNGQDYEVDIQADWAYEDGECGYPGHFIEEWYLEEVHKEVLGIENYEPSLMHLDVPNDLPGGIWQALTNLIENDPSYFDKLEPPEYDPGDD